MAVGSAVAKVRVGDVVIMPFAYSDGSCEFCHEGLHTACSHGGFFGWGGEALRVPQADGTLYILPSRVDEALMRPRC
jgi:threonine dehydrogenase-like Zn-dependent dehydrogenase